MKALIIEDEIPVALQLKKMLIEDARIITVLEVCRTVKDSVKWLKANEVPDIIFMDIELTDGKSFEIFEQVQIVSPVIFTTAYDAFAIKAIKLNALDYLLKPINKAELSQAISKVQKSIVEHSFKTDFSELHKLIASLYDGKPPKKLAIRTMNGSIFVNISDIVRLEADSNYTNVFLTSGKKHIIARTLKEYDELLSEFGFYRTHSSSLINLAYVTAYQKDDGGSVIMNDGSIIEVSQNRKKGLLEALSIN